MRQIGVVPQAKPAIGVAPRRVQSALIEALSADDAVLRANRSGWKNARVHSVFEHVINVDFGNGRLLTLASRDSDNAPDTIVADVGTWQDRGVRVGHAVHFMGEKIFLGEGHCVSVEEARSWSCHLPKYVADDARLHENLALARACVESLGSGIGIAAAPGRAASEIETTLAAQFLERRQALGRAIAAGQESAAREAVDRLVGLGPGLTPAGDDFLLGLLAAMNLPQSPCALWRRIGTQVIASAVRRTNAISAAALRHAACGEVRESLVQLCHALMHKEASAMLEDLRRVLAIGASSGTDIALGMLCGFELHLRQA